MNTRLIAFVAAACMSAVAVAQTTGAGQTGQTGTSQTGQTGQTGQIGQTGQTGTGTSTGTGMQSTTNPQNRGQNTADPQSRSNSTGLNQSDVNRNKAADCLDMDTNRTRNTAAGAPRSTNPNCDNNSNTRKNTNPPPVRQP